MFVFFDDILVYITNWQEHIYLNQAFQVLSDNKLIANRKKCYFAQRSVEYLRHIISRDGVTMDPAKVQCVLQCPIPKNVKGL